MAEGHYYYGTGRRKSSVARVRVYVEPGEITVNGKPLAEALHGGHRIRQVEEALRVANVTESVTVVAKCHGGGVTGQAGALAHGLARALLEMDPNLREALRSAGLLTRDSRIKESKKYGLKRARKAPQYTKR